MQPVTSVFNDGVIAEQFERYRHDPSSVDESWRQYFRAAESLLGSAPASGGASASPDSLAKVAKAEALIQKIRQYGHLAVPLDPLGTAPLGARELTLEFHGLTEADLRAIPASVFGFDNLETALDVVERLRQRYCTTIGYEYQHISSEEEREWFRAMLRAQQLTRPLTADEKKWVLKRLTQVDSLERFLGRVYLGVRRFSIEGLDVMVPMLDLAIEEGAKRGAREVAIGMAHRGRINVLAHILGKPYATIFNEFEGRHASGNAESETGDVKYHLGLRTSREAAGHEVRVILMPNPSHLEFVNAVLAGATRAEQRGPSGKRGERDETSVVPVVIHGDAAFPGEGIVAETMNLSRLRGYRVGGTLHIIANNQVGFTTDPVDARSTHYASDVAKGFEIPIMHVNGDDAEACLNAMRVAVAYRTRFRKDVVIDVVGFRRHGHNESDEPVYTQPELYARVKSHASPRQVWADRLVRDGVVTLDEAAQMEKDVVAEFERILAGVKQGTQPVGNHRPTRPEQAPTPAAIETKVPAQRLTELNEQLLTYPDGWTPNPRLAKQLERRRDAMGGAAAIDWGHAESLAFASLLTDGMPIRITGQDAERGTFSHRHAVLHDPNTGKTHTPLATLANAAPLEIYNSPLSETAVLGFEYGFSVVAPDTLVLWEAQFGDFVNVAQPIIDQFLAADRAKWGQDSGVVMLLPHGYEGQGPEHSSARPERFLQLCAENNLRVAYCSTPAQYFHVLRRQAKQTPRRPMVLMQPKSLLRLPDAASTLADLSDGSFRPVIDDASAAQRRERVTRLVLCSGKVYYDLMAAKPGEHVAVVRVEELYPWPQEEIGRVIDACPNVEEVVWVQEEPKNMGFWSFVSPRLRVSTGNAMVVRYVGRPDRASPAEGYADAHKAEQARIVAEALAPVAEKGTSNRKRSTAKA